MAEDVQGIALQITYKGTIGSLKVLTQLISKLLEERNKNAIVHGQQSLQNLNKQGRQLESVNLPGEDIKAFRQQLKRYNVDFSVMKDGNTGEQTVFFKAQDVDRVYKGLENCVKGLSLDKSDEKKPIKDVMAKAEQKARDQAIEAKGKEDRQKKKEVNQDK